MALTLGDNFSYQGAKPLDARLKYDTLAQMKAVADATMYDGCLAYCVATDKTYQWKSTNTVDGTLGKWREFSSGGGGGSSTLAELTDVNLTEPTDGQLLKYDATSGKWINGSGGSVTVESLGDIEDVDLSELVDGQVIRWDATANKWVNASVPKERELTQAEYASLSEQEKMNGTTYYITDGGGLAYNVKKRTLVAGTTSVSMSVPSSGDYLTNIYTTDGRDYLSATVTTNTLTITFEAPNTDIDVYVEFRGV